MFCSTSEVYGNVGQDGRKIKITDSIMPANPYGASKAAIDLYMQERMTSGKLKGFITRAFSHTGPRRGKNFSISSDAFQIAKMILGMQEPKLLVGNLKSVRVVVDVRDIVNAYYLLMINEQSTGKVFNVSGDVPYEMQHYTDLLISASKVLSVKQVRHEPFWRQHDIHYQHGDCTTLIDMTNWSPVYDLETTIQDLLDYWVKKLS
jgi:GDPmannose 4,6-dehydratase